MIISLKDNQYKAVPWDEAVNADASLNDKQQELLKHFSEVSLKKLSENKEYGNFLVFPSKSAKNELEDKDYIFKLVGKDPAKPSFLTGNVMGFFRLGDDVQMRITSRFDQSGKNFFLHYMLQKICNVAVVPQETDTEQDDFFDFLYYLFPKYLNDACRQGIYRAYVTREYNDANVRGPIDVARHIRFNTPFNGKIAYHTREYTTDNKVTQLIRHTIEYIRCLKFGSSVFENNEDARDNEKDIVAATPTYIKNSRHQVIGQNLHPITHPYYTAYEPLRKLCLAILCHKKMSYGSDNDNPIAGILFDGASLWEEYLAKVFEENGLGLTHSNNRSGGNGISLLNGGRKNHYPDFYRKKKDGRNAIVLDAKYKRLYHDYDDEFENSMSNAPIYKGGDVMQMLAYMHALEAQTAILLSPFESSREGAELQMDFKETCGYNSKVGSVGLPIYTGVAGFAEFSNNMKKVEKAFLDRIKEFL